MTGAGAALDAASRGLSTVLVERHDLAFGTSRWSSKLVHGGLRYLARGQFGIAYESARERDLLMRVTAPHLVRPMPMVVPVYRGSGLARALSVRAGMGMGDLLRVMAGTPGSVLPRPRLLDARQTLRLLPGAARRDLLGGILSFDGQLVDDARLVVALARTAAREGARVITRCSAESVTADGAVLRDAATGRIVPVRRAPSSTPPVCTRGSWTPACGSGPAGAVTSCSTARPWTPPGRAHRARRRECQPLRLRPAPDGRARVRRAHRRTRGRPRAARPRRARGRRGLPARPVQRGAGEPDRAR
ncbi:FAD-dependent oxidoreductase [Nocardiopsis sp. ARC36]